MALSKLEKTKLKAVGNVIRNRFKELVNRRIVTEPEADRDKIIKDLRAGFKKELNQLISNL